MRPARYSYEVNQSGRPKSRKLEERKQDERKVRDKKSQEGNSNRDAEVLPSLKSLWGDKTNKNTRRMATNDRPLLKHRSKAHLVVGNDAPTPINRRTRLNGSSREDRKFSISKKKGRNPFHHHKKEELEVSNKEVEDFVLEDTRNELLPDDFEYDLRLYNSPACKAIRSNSGVLRLAAHPCLSSNPDRELLYRTWQQNESEVPAENYNVWEGKKVSKATDISFHIDPIQDLPPVTPPRTKSQKFDADQPSFGRLNSMKFNQEKPRRYNSRRFDDDMNIRWSNRLNSRTFEEDAAPQAPPRLHGSNIAEDITSTSPPKIASRNKVEDLAPVVPARTRSRKFDEDFAPVVPARTRSRKFDEDFAPVVPARIRSRKFDEDFAPVVPPRTRSGKFNVDVAPRVPRRMNSRRLNEASGPSVPQRDFGRSDKTSGTSVNEVARKAGLPIPIRTVRSGRNRVMPLPPLDDEDGPAPVPPPRGGL